MSIMEIGAFTVWSDPETMTTTVSVDGRTEQVTQTVGEMLEILGRYVTRLQDENAKLRELVRDIYKILSALDIDYCGACPQDNALHPCPRYTIFGGDCKYVTAMHELGVDVDDGD